MCALDMSVSIILMAREKKHLLRLSVLATRPGRLFSDCNRLNIQFLVLGGHSSGTCKWFTLMGSGGSRLLILGLGVRASALPSCSCWALNPLCSRDSGSCALITCENSGQVTMTPACAFKTPKSQQLYSCPLLGEDFQ